MAILDTAAMKDQMLAWRNEDKWQLACMAFLDGTIDVMKSIAELKYNGKDEAEGHRLVVMQTLAIRMLNTIGAADEMLLQGYYQQTAILVRDIMECSFLLDLFSRLPEHLQPWIDSGLDPGKNGYSPVKVRKMLEDLDGPEAEIRQKLYGFYSAHGTHPNAKGTLFIAPENNAVEIGPFASQRLLVALTGDITRMSVLCSVHLGRWLIVTKIDLVEDDAFNHMNDLIDGLAARFLELGALLQQMPGLADETQRGAI